MADFLIFRCSLVVMFFNTASQTLLTQCLDDACSGPRKTIDAITCVFSDFDLTLRHNFTCLNTTMYLTLVQYGNSESLSVGENLSRFTSLKELRIAVREQSIDCFSMLELPNIQRVIANASNFEGLRSCFNMRPNVSVSEFSKADVDAYLTKNWIFTTTNTPLLVLIAICVLLIAFSFVKGSDPVNTTNPVANHTSSGED